MGIVVFYYGMATVFYFDTGNAVEYLIVGHMNIVTHTNINSGIFNTGHDIVLNQAISSELRENTINTRIHYDIIANLKIVTRLTHDAIAFILGNTKVFDNNIVARIENGVVELAQTIKSCPLTCLNNPTQMDIIFVDIDGL